MTMHWGRCGRSVGIVCVLAALVPVLGACGSSDEESGTGSASTAREEQVELAVFMAGQTGYTEAELDGIRAVAAKLGANVTVFDARFDAATQSAQLQTEIGQDEFDAFIITPLSTQIVPRIAQAAAKGVKVVCMLSQCGSELNTAEPQVEGQIGFVGSLPAPYGALLAEQAAAACEDADPCQVAFMEGSPAISLDVEQTNAFKAELAKHPALELVSVQAGQLAEQPAFGAAQNVLSANPDLDVYAAATSPMAFGVERAIKRGSNDRDIRIVNRGASTRAVEAVKAGRFFSTLVGLPFTEGELAATVAIKAARGERTRTGIDMLTESPIGPVLTRDNATDFEAQFTD